MGYEQPILHGLASMGISVRQVLQVFGRDQPASIQSVKVRGCTKLCMVHHVVLALGLCLDPTLAIVVKTVQSFEGCTSCGVFAAALPATCHQHTGFCTKAVPLFELDLGSSAVVTEASTTL